MSSDPMPQAGRRVRLRRRAATGVRRFWRVMMEANVTGSSAMVAYNMLLGVVPVALLALFVGGQILSSHSVQQSVLRDLRGIFPGADAQTLDSLLDEIQSSTTSTGVVALLASLWLGSSFWGALDTAFAPIYGCKSRSWLEQKRFALGMLIVVLLFMMATVSVPAAQSMLNAGAPALPFDLARVTGAVYAVSLLVGLALLFASLAVIYARVPNRKVAGAPSAGGTRRNHRHRGSRPRVPAVPDEYLHDRPVRHHNRVHPDPPRLVLRGGACDPQRRDRERDAARGRRSRRGSREARSCPNHRAVRHNSRRLGVSW